MKKIYKDINVYDASMERIEFIFNEFENIVVSFSGGKDSGVLLNLCLKYMREYNITKKLIVFIVDLEAQYKATMDFIQSMIDDNQDLLEVYWCCLPLNLRNAISVFQPFWTCWDKDKKDLWVRDYPKGCINEDNHPFDFFYPKMEFEEFTPKFAEWLQRKYMGSVVVLVGIRCDESLNRFRTIASTSKVTYKKKQWTTKIRDKVFNAYPIYDWRTEDIWVANYINKWKYNTIYDLFHKAGVSLCNMRICQPYGDDQRQGINLFKILEPQTWLKVISRTAGVNFGNIYCKTKMLGVHKCDLPKGHTWRSYTKLLLATLPKELADNYKKKFIKFIKFWHREGGFVGEDTKRIASEIVKDLGRNSNRGGKKPLTIFKRIPDSIDPKLESKKECPTWRRMAICIIKNDVLCKGLSFTQTKEQVLKQREILEKYKNL